MNFKSFITFTILFWISLALAFLLGFAARPLVDTNDEGDYSLLNEVIHLIGEYGLKSLPSAQQIEYGLIRGLIQVYDDPHTTFNEPTQHELLSNNLEGKYGGIGVRLEKDDEGYILLYPYPNSPALLSGLQEGDRLIQVEEVKITPETQLDTILAEIRGPIGVKVSLIISRAPNYLPHEILIKRSEVPLPSVTWNLNPEDARIGMIKMNIIAATTSREIEGAFSDLENRGANFFILDLRDNGGGLLDAGVDIARLFLSKGVVISQQYRGKPVVDYRVTRPGPLAEKPIMVLVNQGTASAAEIIAGALQAHNKARLVGSPTYGKDTIQQIFVLEDQSSLRVTAARWWLPGLESGISETGLLPDFSLGGEDNRSLLQIAGQVFGITISQLPDDS